MPRNKVIDIHPSDEHQVEVDRRTHTRTLMFFFLTLSIKISLLEQLSSSLNSISKTH